MSNKVVCYYDGDIIMIVAGKYSNKKGIVKSWECGNTYTVEVMSNKKKIVLHSHEMMSIYKYDNMYPVGGDII